MNNVEALNILIDIYQIERSNRIDIGFSKHTQAIELAIEVLKNQILYQWQEYPEDIPEGKHDQVLVDLRNEDGTITPYLHDYMIAEFWNLEDKEDPEYGFGRWNDRVIRWKYIED